MSNKLEPSSIEDPRGGGPLPAAGAITFGECTIDIGARDVSVGGRTQRPPPLVFDLLLFLIERRHRVVTKEELLEHVWRGSVVTESVIARAVMKARRVIEDDGAGRVLKTVHRIGYRFDSSVEIESRTSARAETVAFMRLAVLPFDNATGDPSLDWAAQGLPKVVGHALQADTRLSIVDAGTIDQAVELLPQADDRTIATLVGARCTVRAALRRTGGRFSLAYRMEGEPASRGEVVADDVALAAIEVAQAIEDTLFPDDHWPVRHATSDPLAAQSFARAMAMSKLEQWPTAEHLLQVVVDLEPDNLAARLHHLRVLANLHDRKALDVGNRLLEEAARRGDTRLLAATHEALGRACFNLDGEALVQQSRTHMARALELSAPFSHEDWVVRIHLGLAIQAQLARDYALARHHYGLARLADARVGSVIRETAVLSNLAIIEGLDGNPTEGVELAGRALAACERHGLAANEVDARATLALSQAQLGLLGPAFEQSQRNLAALRSLPAHECDSAAWGLLIAADVEALGRRPGDTMATLADVRGLWREPGPRVDVLLQATGAHLEAAQGRWPLAVELFAAAVDKAVTDGYFEIAPMLAVAWVEAALRTRASEAGLARIESLAGLRAHDDVRGALGRHFAVQCFAQGDGAGALAALLEAVATTPVGRVNALARIDAAWILAGQGRHDEARRLVRAIVPWMRQHPVGMALERRMADPARDAGSALPSLG